MTPFVIALAVGILVYGAFMLLVPRAVPDDEGDYLRQALDRLAQENIDAEKARVEVLRDQLNDETPLVRMVFGLPFMQPVYESGLQAGYQHHLQQVLVYMLLIFAAALAVLVVLGAGLLSPIVAFALAYLLPMYHCRKRVRKRNHTFIDQFPDALDMIVRSVRSGFPLSVALQMLAENTEEPMRSEFRQVTDEIALGRSLNQSLARLSTRIDEPDIHFFVVVLSVQQETGGNLGEIIGNLSSIIRKRKQLRHKIRAMTSEGRATGVVLGAMPLVVFGALMMVQPNYLQPFFTDSLGQTLLASAIGLLVACFFIVKQMINVDI
jgi:tight adherence protein B